MKALWVAKHEVYGKVMWGVGFDVSLRQHLSCDCCRELSRQRGKENRDIIMKFLKKKPLEFAPYGVVFDNEEDASLCYLRFS